MGLMGSISAYDALGMTVVTARVWQYDHGQQEGRWVLLERTVELEPSFEENPRQWLIDALVGCIEGM
jgi:hypothetical protein